MNRHLYIPVSLYRVLRLSPGFLLAMVAGGLAAQDIRVGLPGWLQGDHVGEEPPAFKREARVSPPRELRAASDYGYAWAVHALDAKGKVVSQDAVATHPYLHRAVEDSLRGGWSFGPATRDGEPVAAVIGTAVIFNPRGAPESGPEAQPRLLEVRRVTATRKVIGPGREMPTVWASVAVDATGAAQTFTLEEPADERFREAIAAALPGWRFAPARRNGEAVAATVRAPFLITTPLRKGIENSTPPRPIKQVDPEYPVALLRSGLRGEVTLEFVVEMDGRVTNPVVVRSTNPGFDAPAIEALYKWTFRPGQREGKPIKAKLRVGIIFERTNIAGGGADAFQMRDYGDQSRLPEEFRYDTPPKTRGTVTPAWPYELLAGKKTGDAKVVVQIDPRGRVIAAEVVKADEPAFGQALVAAAEMFEFEPALRAGKPVTTMLALEHRFGWREAAEDRELLERIEKKPETLARSDALDAPVAPVSRRAPVWPAALRDRTAGQAVVEFVVDEKGRVRLPRVVSADDPAFGFAAVQAASAWRFVPLRAGGKPALVRLRVPVHFAGKASPAAAAEKR